MNSKDSKTNFTKSLENFYPCIGYICCVVCKLFPTIVNYLTDIKRNVAIRRRRGIAKLINYVMGTTAYYEPVSFKQEIFTNLRGNKQPETRKHELLQSL